MKWALFYRYLISFLYNIQAYLDYVNVKCSTIFKITFFLYQMLTFIETLFIVWIQCISCDLPSKIKIKKKKTNSYKQFNLQKGLINLYNPKLFWSSIIMLQNQVCIVMIIIVHHMVHSMFVISLMELCLFVQFGFIVFLMWELHFFVWGVIYLANMHYVLTLTICPFVIPLKLMWKFIPSVSFIFYS